MHASEMLVAVMIPLGFFLLIFGIIYMHKRENLAMIEKGMNPKVSRPAPYKNLKWALLLIGAGTGLFIAYILDNFVLYPGVSALHDEGEVTPVYFALIAIGGGLGLFGSYKMEKKWWVENKEKL